MLPPTLHLAAPRALAIASPHVTAGVALAVAPAAYNVALQLSNKGPTLQIDRARQFHWWCRRSPRRYSSWNRSNAPPNPIDGTEQRRERDYTVKNEDRNEPVVERDDYELSPREKMWQIRRDFFQRIMRNDAYEGIFGPSNRMLWGLNWRNGPYAAEWKKMWEQHMKEMDRMHSGIRQRIEQTFGGKTFESKPFLDQFLGKERSKYQVKPMNADKAGTLKEGWIYDAISNRMVPEKPAEPKESHDWVEIPVKPFEPKVRTSITRAENQLVNKETEAAKSISLGAEVVKDAPSPPPADPVSAPIPSTQAANETGFPEDEVNALTAEEVRARMGRQRASVETPEQKVEDASPVGFSGAYTRREQSFPRPAMRPAINHALEARKAMDEAVWKLQREQHREAAKDFQVREKKVRKMTRENTDKHRGIENDLSALRQRCDELARRGTLTLLAKDFNNLKMRLDADNQVLGKASALISKAVLHAPKFPAANTPEHMEPSLDRYAWDQKPFAKMIDVEELNENVRRSLDSVQETLEGLTARVNRRAMMAGKLEKEVEAQRRVMRGIEEKWHKRNDQPQMPLTAVPEQMSNDTELVKEIKGIYEDRYGTISTKHRQEEQDPALSALDEQVNIGQNDIKVTGYQGEPLVEVPDLAPASFDGGSEPEMPQSSSTAAAESTAQPTEVPSEASNPLTAVAASEFTSSLQTPATETSASPQESSYTVLALDPAMGQVREICTGSTARDPNEKPMPLSAALQQLAQPAMFLPYLPKLKDRGFEPVSSSENVLVLKQTSPPAASRDPEDYVETYYPASVGKSIANETHLEAAEHGKDSYEGPVYSTRLQSPTTTTFQGTKPKRTEPVFSGTQGGHQNYEQLKSELRRRSMKARRRQEYRKKFWARRLLKWVRLVMSTAVVCYIAGVMMEVFRDGRTGLYPYQDRKRLRDEESD